MSTFNVEICKVASVSNHPGADRLDLITLRGKDWQVVTAKGNFKPDDLVVYFPVDSILPSELEAKIFGIDSKVKLNNSRVRTIKLRGAISQGLAVKPEVVGILEEVEEGDCYNTFLGVKKYEAPVRLAGGGTAANATRKQVNPNFRKYTSIENAKNYPQLFQDNEVVSVTEKIHGTNFRCGYVPYYENGLWRKLLKWANLAPKYEFVYGSHNVQLQNKMLVTTYYDKNVYAEAVAKYNLKEVLKPGEVIYGEIYGDGIQKNYNYGCKPGERKAVFFDLMEDGQWMDTLAFRQWAQARQLPIVPELYRGPFNKERVYSLRDGNSVLEPTQRVREGVIVKPLKEEHTYAGRKVLKFVSDEYLLKNQDNESEAH